MSSHTWMPFTKAVLIISFAHCYSLQTRAQTAAVQSIRSVPSCVLTATPKTILVGDGFDLSWTSRDAKSASFKGGQEAMHRMPLPPVGSMRFNMPVRSLDMALSAGKYTYTLQVSNDFGSFECSAAVTVSWRSLPSIPRAQRSIGLAGYSDVSLSRPACTSTACAGSLTSELDGRKFFWAANYPRAGTLTSTYYPYDRDPDASAHGRAWYEQNHPDWLAYKSDKIGLADLFTYASRPTPVPIDITNVAVREYILAEHWIPKLARGFQSVSLDNVTTFNVAGRRYVKTSVGWKEILPAPALPPARDPAWIRAIGDWLDWSRTQLHARGALLAANLDWGQQISQPDFVALAHKVDIVVVEKGAWNPGATTSMELQNSEYGTCIERAPLRYDLDQAWVTKFNTLRQIAVDQGLVLIGECLREANISPSLVQWAIANYLLIREDRTLLLLTGLNEPESGRLFDHSDLHIDIGSPVEAPHEVGGLWVRRYRSGVAIVNPSSAITRRFFLGTDRYKDAKGHVYSDMIEIPAKSGFAATRE